jgi:hypothetical protein
MNRNSIIKGAFIAFCLIGMLVLPAAAAPAGQMTASKGTVIDQGLKDDLWNNHKVNRLETFDTNVRHAESTLSILGHYGIDTSACQSTLSIIESRRSDLEAALTTHDRQKLNTVNAELKTLWQQFMKNVREALRSYYGPRAGISTGMEDAVAGFVTT